MDLLGETIRVTEGEYEEKSYEVIQDALLVYDQTTQKHGPTTTFVDGQLLKTISNRLFAASPIEVRTCFHKHQGPHRGGEYRVGSPVERVLTYLRRARANADSKGEPIKVLKEPLVR
jgi:hypothetical protein